MFRFKSLPWTLGVIALLTLANILFAQVVFQEGFEGKVGRWKTYHRDPPQAKISVVTDGAADGNKFMRIECPGNLTLEGARMRAGSIKPFSLYKLRAKVRGQGTLWPIMKSSNGWHYPATVPLTGQWQEIAVTKLTGVRGGRLEFYFVTRKAHQARFDIDAITLTQEPDPPVTETEVTPVRLEAETYSPHLGWVKEDSDALGGKAVCAYRNYTIKSLPFPLTSKTVYAYLRVKPGTPTDTYQLCAEIEGYLHVIAKVKAKQPTGWQWVRFKAAKPAAARGCVTIRVSQRKKGQPPAMLDALVIATRGDLTPEELKTAPLHKQGRPLIAVGRCATPPVIDGRADEPCWADCVAIHDFALQAEAGLPTQKTVARICYDSKRLYIAFRCQEDVLDPVANRLDDFQQSKTERDSDLWSDDCVAVILGPTGGPYFDTFCNARGAIDDARCEIPNLWGSRNNKWNGNILASARVEDGFWEVEMSIGFDSLGVRAPKSGDRWKLCLGRVAKSAREVSVWNPVAAGIHDLSALGTLLFLPRVGGAALKRPVKIGGGKNVATLHRARKASPVLADVTLRKPKKADKFFRKIGAPGATAEVALDVSSTGPVMVSYDLLNAGDLGSLYLSPFFNYSPGTSNAKVWLVTTAPYTVFLNGKRVANGPKSDGSKAFTTPLHTGVNAFSFQVESGRLSAVIDMAGHRLVSNGTWRFTPDLPAQFAATAFNDSKWARAEVLGPGGGAPGKEGAKEIGGPSSGVVRRVIWHNKTYLWPDPDPAQHIPQNAAQHLTFIAKGMEGRKLEGFQMFLAVPPEFEVIGSTGYYANNPKTNKAHFVTSGPEKARLNNQKVLRYTITATKAIPYRPKARILELFNVFVRYRGPAKPAKQYNFTYWTEAEEGCITECPRIFPVRVTAPLHGKQPKKLVWQLWSAYGHAMDDPALREATLATMRAAGLNESVWLSPEDAALGKKYGIISMISVSPRPDSLRRDGYLQEHPEDALVDADGNRSDKLVCTTALFSHGWDDMARMLYDRVSLQRAAAVTWDYENGPWGYIACYCPKCLAAFRKHAGLGENVTLNSEMLRGRYSEQWVEFMTTRLAQAARKFRDACKAHGVRFSMYSGYQSARTRHRYGVDWRKISQHKSVDYVSCGYGRRTHTLDATLAALDGVPLVVGEHVRPTDPGRREKVTPLTKARVLRRQADSTGGILIYNRNPLAGRSWYALAEVSRLIADYEDVFLNGMPSPELAKTARALEPEFCIKQLGRTALVMLMNEGKDSRTLTVDLDWNMVDKARLYYGEKPIDAGATVSVQLPPGEAEAIVLTLR